MEGHHHHHREEQAYHYGYNYLPNTVSSSPGVPQIPSSQLPHLIPFPPATDLYHLPPNTSQYSLPAMSTEEAVPEPPVKKTRRRRGEGAAGQSGPSRPSVKTNPNPGIVIKTKFPVARIKRIMQADEDVGKVAQVTPVIVSKALELFMIALCAKASEQARLRNSKRINASHLKQAVLAEEQFDFLADIMAKVPDVSLPTESSSHGNASDEETGNSGPTPGSAKKPRKPRTRKVKEDEA